MITKDLNSFLVIILFGALVLLSFVLLVNPLQVNKRANLWFGIFLLMWASFWTEEIVQLISNGMIPPIVDLLLRSFQFFIPIVFYLSTLFYTNPEYKFKAKDLAFLALPIIYILALIVGTSQEASWLQVFLNVLIIIHALFYTILSYVKITDHKKKINLFASNTEEIDLGWLESIIISLLAMCVFIGIYNVIYPAGNLNLIANSFSLGIIYFVAIHTVRQKEIFLLDESERSNVIESNQPTSQEKKKLISDQELVVMKTKLSELMLNAEPYLQPDLSLHQLAEIMQITPHQLSYLINVGFDENFFTFVNAYRVEKVKQLLKDDTKKNLAILGIAYESGFNSKTSFYTTFKKITFMTPSEYLKRSSKL